MGLIAGGDALAKISAVPVAVSQDGTPAPIFRFHMPTEPSSLDPALLIANDASYFLMNVMRGLYTYSDTKGLVPEGAERCLFETPLRLNCKLAKDAKWSDGSPVVAEDYVRAFRRLVRPDAKNLSIELLKHVVNAVAINGGKKPTSELGIRAIGKDRLMINFEKADPDFLYKLTSSVLVPVRSEKFPKREDSSQAVINGPYKVASWSGGRRIRLEPNLFYTRGAKDRPPVEILMIDDDQTALQLYEQGELSFLRRLPTTYIPAYRSRPDFLQVPVARLDYLGFGDDLKDQPDLRAALSQSADFSELKKVLDSRGLPGCPGLDESEIAPLPCVKFDVAKAKAALARVSPEVLKKRLKMSFSKLGGDDVKKVAEWFQAQWKKNLELNVELEQAEQVVHLQRLRTKPPPIYRKGLHLDRPTCLAAIEPFAKDGADNFLKIEDPVFESKLKELSETQIGNAKNKKEKMRALCSQAVQRLLDQGRFLPLGAVHFTLLAKPEFKGWELNEMNQFNLAGLHAARTTK